MPSRPRVNHKRSQLTLPLIPRERLVYKKLRSKLVAASAGMALVISLFGVASWFSHTESFAVRGVYVTGANKDVERKILYAAEEILYRSVHGLFSGAHVWLFSEMNLERELLERFPRAARISVKRESLLAQAVRINVVERVAHHTWCGNEQHCFLMDAEGFVFAPGTATDGYTFYDGLGVGEPIGRNFLRGSLPKVVDLLDQLREHGLQIIGTRVDNEADFTILTDTFSIKVAFESDNKKIARNIMLALSSEDLKGERKLDYLDVRFGNRAYFKFQGEQKEEPVE